MPDAIRIPRSLYTAPVWDQIVFLSDLQGGVRVSRKQTQRGGRLVFIVEAGGCSTWDPILAKALHGLLRALERDEKATG